MPTSPSDLLGDSLFQLNLLLWMLQPPNRSNIRPLLSEAGYKLRSIEETLPLSPALLTRLSNAALTAKEDAAPDAILLNDNAEHLLVECKASMFGPQPSKDGRDGNQRQARSFLLQTPPVLRSALAGSAVKGTHLAYLTRHNDKHDQTQGVRALADELQQAKLPTVECCVWRLLEHEGGIGMVVPKSSEKWPTTVRAACKTRRGSKAIKLIPRDDFGNDIRPLYFIPWMPESEPEHNEYNSRAFGNRILGAAVVRIGRTEVGEDAVLNYEELLDEVTLGVFAKWRNKDAKKSLRERVRKLLADHLVRTGALRYDPDGSGQSIAVKLSEEKIKSGVIKAFRETISMDWDKPDPQGKLFPEDTGKGDAA